MIPSQYIGDGMEIIDATKENIFSAKISGRAPVVAYQCGIFKNNATSDLVYDSGVVKLDKPCYGADSKGNIVPFEYTIPPCADALDNYTVGATYNSESGEYTLSFDSFTYEPGAIVGFKVPADVGDVSSVSIITNGKTFVVAMNYDGTKETEALKDVAVSATLSSAYEHTIGGFLWEAGDTVIVNWTGIEYVCYATSATDPLVLKEDSSVKLPFSLYHSEDGLTLYCGTTGESQENTLSITVRHDIYSVVDWKAGDIVFVSLHEIDGVATATPTDEVEYTTMENGYIYGYKYILTLWWDLNENDYSQNCIDSFETVFWAKATPTITVDVFYEATDENGVPVVTNKVCDWGATYSHQSNVGVAWFQWILAEAADRTRIVDDTERIYTNSPISYEFSGLSTGQTYSICVNLQTQDGVTITSDWVDFTVDYEVVEIKSAVVVSHTEYDGIKVDWGNLKYVTGHPNNSDYRYLKPLPAEGHTCVELLSGNNITFTSSEHFDVDIPIEAEHVWSGYLREDSEEIYYAEGTDADGNPYYIKLYHRGAANGLYPSETLYPSDTLYPLDDIGGEFVLDINGETTLVAENSPLPLHWFVVRMSDNNLVVHESEFDPVWIENAQIISPQEVQQ